MSLTQDAMENAVRETQQEMEREIHGAWRAGYNYVHVYRPIVNLARADPTEQFTLTQYTLPSNYPPIHPDGLQYEYSFDLSSVPDDVVREMIEQGAGIGVDLEGGWGLK